MPYSVLDFIERSAIRDHLGPAEILELLQVNFPAHSRERLCLWTHRFFTLWSRNQWKRERYAPGFHLNDENLDPKTHDSLQQVDGAAQRAANLTRQVQAALHNPAPPSF